MKKYYQKHKLGTITLIWLFVIMVISIVVVTTVGILVQNYYQRRQAFSMISDYLSENTRRIDPHERINEYFIEWMDEIVDVEGASRKKEFCDNDKLRRIALSNPENFNEVSFVDRDGIIAYSSDPELIGTDIRKSTHLAPFACILEGEGSYSDSFSASPFTDSVKTAYVGTAFRDKDGFMLWGMDEEIYRRWILYRIITVTEYSKIGMTGYIINVDPEKKINCVTHRMKDVVGETFTADFVLPEEEGSFKETICEFYGEKCYVGAIKTRDCYVIGAYPVSEADQFRLQNNILFAVLFDIVLSAFFLVVFLMLRRLVIKGVEQTHTSLNRITAGDLDEKVDVRGSVEFSELSSGINETVARLKDLIREEDERVKNELLNAKYIQESAVPGHFPPYPENKAFGLFASMNAAQDVGGDFYDFFMVNEDTLVFVMADVCGKGLPASLYMMRAKTLIKNFAERGLPVDQVAEEVNNKLCEDTSNDAFMFVTAWIGFLDIRSGVISYVHAGHTYPVLISNEVSFVQKEIDIVLGGFKGTQYERQEIRLQPGDSIYLYTDGVTEARNPDGKLYGDNRLLGFISDMAGDLNSEDRNDYCREACERILVEVKDFESDAGQADDITMMWIKYTGPVAG